MGRIITASEQVLSKPHGVQVVIFRPKRAKMFPEMLFVTIVSRVFNLIDLNEREKR